MSITADQLYALLPAIYRTRDAGNGYALKSLFTVFAQQAGILEENIQQLYDDEFIETCASWVIPYIGDLVGATPVYELGSGQRGRRAEVANTIGYRRRKGTLLAIEQVAMDVSGRPAKAVEFFKRLITNESMRLVRPDHAADVNLRDGTALDRLNSAFDDISRTVDVRRIAPPLTPPADPDPTPLAKTLHGGGRYNIPDVGIYVWRWKSNAVVNAPAFALDSRRYRFSSLGLDIPLFNALATRASFARLTTRSDVPQPVTRREMFENLQQFYGAGLSVQLSFGNMPVPPSQICVRNLSGSSSWGCTPDDKIAIDPELGRIHLGANYAGARNLRVSYHYGFPADLGGGPYDRSGNVPPIDPAQFTFRRTVGQPGSLTLTSAINAWNTQPAGTQGLIILPDFESLTENISGAHAIVLPAESALTIVSGQVQAGGVPGLAESCVTLRGEIEVRAKQPPNPDPANPPAPGRLTLNGVWLSGAIHISGGPSAVTISDCTLVPGVDLHQPSITIDGPGASLLLVNSIAGPVAAVTGASVRVCSSIIDSGSRCSVAYSGVDAASEGADLHIENSTVVGKVRAHSLTLASNTIFLAMLGRKDPWPAPVWCSRRQSGCVRFCYLPPGSITPRTFECLQDQLPQFVSLRFGSPSYGLLSGDVPRAIWTGADDGSQMGVYHSLQETEAVRNVHLRMPEFLPFNLEAGVFLEPSNPELTPLPVVVDYGRPRLLDPCVPETDQLMFMGIGAHLI